MKLGAFKFQAQHYAPKRIYWHKCDSQQSTSNINKIVRNCLLYTKQKKAIRSSVGGHDVLISLATGIGMSACFRSHPFLFDIKCGVAHGTSIILVIWSLKKLRKDHVGCLFEKGIGVREERLAISR